MDEVRDIRGDYGELLCANLSRLSSGGYYCGTRRNFVKESGDVGDFQHFQVFIGGSALSPYHLFCGVINGNFPLFEKCHYLLHIEFFLAFGNEPAGIIEEDDSEYPPHIVLKIRIIERHRPTSGIRRETAEHKGGGLRGEERVKGMVLAGRSGHCT